MREFLWGVGILVITNVLLVLSLLAPNLTLTWVLFSLAGVFGPAVGFLGLYLDQRRYRAFIDDYDRSLRDGLRRISSLRYARRVRKVALAGGGRFPSR